MVYYPLSYYITILIPIWETKRIGVEPIQIMTVPWSFSVGNLSGPLSTFLHHNRFFQLPLDWLCKAE